MTAGDTALAGDSSTVRDVGADLRGRMFATDVGAKLNEAAASLGNQSGNAVSVDRTMAMIQAALAPAELVQLTDQSWGDAAETLGVQMEDIASRTRKARMSLADAKGLVASKQDALDEFDQSSDDDSESRSRRSFTRALDSAEESVASAQQQLKALDEERRGADSTAATTIGAQSSQYVSARTSLPPVPHLSAGVSVSVTMPDRSVQSVSAVDLAGLKDPAAIRAVWDAMTPEQRQTLITDFPMLIGNLEGIPLRDRNTANVITATAHRAELEKQIELLTQLEQRGARGDLTDMIADMQGEVKSIDAMLGDRNDKYPKDETTGDDFGVYLLHDENGRAVKQNGVVIVGFNPLRDSYITFQGALDPVSGDIPSWMEQVGVVVPGTTSRLAVFTDDIDRSKDLYAQSGTSSGYFTWHGAPMPQFDLTAHAGEATLRGFADLAAPRLTAFVNSLPVPDGTDVIPIGHSYGVVALAQAEALGLRADRVVYVAPAGLGEEAAGIKDFPETDDVPHFSLQARNDIIVGSSQGKLSIGALGHGLADPLGGPGITRLETGFMDANNPVSGTIEDEGPVDSHSAVFTPNSTSMWNITNAVMGESVSLFHEDGLYERIRSHGRVPRTVTGTGNEHIRPDELISSVTLERVDK